MTCENKHKFKYVQFLCHKTIHNDLFNKGFQSLCLAYNVRLQDSTVVWVAVYLTQGSRVQSSAWAWKVFQPLHYTMYECVKCICIWIKVSHKPNLLAFNWEGWHYILQTIIKNILYQITMILERLEVGQP